MGYSRTIPFQIFTHLNTFPNTISATTVASTQTLGYFTTPEWEDTPTRAYVDLIIQNVHNTNAGANNIRNNVGTLDMALSPDTITYTSCGLWEDFLLNCDGNYRALCFYRIPGTVNLSAYLQPNTTYYCDVRNIVATANNMDLSDLYAELKMVFGE